MGRPIRHQGVLRADEARRAADHGIDAVIVSNHGALEMDHVPATLEVLPDIADAVGDRVEALFDSGIRRGSDIATALALGARAVLVGRAHLYGLAAAAELVSGMPSTSWPGNCERRWPCAARPPCPISAAICCA